MTAAPASLGSPAKQGREQHATHSFVWCLDNTKPTNFVCNKTGTIKDSLMRSSEFIKIAKKNKDKELVIERDCRAVSTHLPCCLVHGGELNVKYIKHSKEQKQRAPKTDLSRRKGPSDELLLFHVLTKGGKNVKRIMSNQNLANSNDQMTVYAYKGETVKQSLKRDGRFCNIVFKKNCALFEKGCNIKTEMLNLVNDLDGKTFKIELVDKSPPPETPPASLDDAHYLQSESQRCPSDAKQELPEQSTTTESVIKNKTEEQTELSGCIRHVIPDSKEMKCSLSSQVSDYFEKLKTQGEKLSEIQNLVQVEYGKTADTCKEVKPLKTLMSHSNSICQIRTNGGAAGSGFLLFDKFVLTNAHVIEKVYDKYNGRLNFPVTVHFSFESLDQIDSGIPVTEVAGIEHGADSSGHMYDWALLGLSADQSLPEGLLNHFGFLPKSGGICIIGHPDGGIKKIDPCWVIPTEDCARIAEKHRNESPAGVFVENQGKIQFVTKGFFEGIKPSPKSLLYESCFYHGSSGSPVFDEHCKVVAMHSGGYLYKKWNKKVNSVIEYGGPLSLILEHIIIQLLERKRVDVLRKCMDVQKEPQIFNNVKDLVENSNNTTFKSAVSNYLIEEEDERLKMCFGSSQKEEPVQMDIDL